MQAAGDAMKGFFCFVLALGISQSFWALAADAPVSQSLEDSRADERFRSMDPGNKGHISFEDFRKRYPDMQRPAFDAIDSNRDGMISLEEWRGFFRSHGTTGSMPPDRMPPPGHGPGGQGGKPLILPPAK